MQTPTKNLSVAQLPRIIKKFLRRKIGVPVMCETIKYKAWELATSHNVQHHFMASRL
jgi:hypothetical protein